MLHNQKYSLAPSDLCGDPSWCGEAFWGRCIDELCASKEASYPKGPLRRGKSKPLGKVTTPIGTIELSVYKNGLADYCLDHFRYFGLLKNHSGEPIGRCKFSVYRPVRGRSWLSENELFLSFDEISQEELELFDVLNSEDESCIEFVFNDADYHGGPGMLVADEIWISPGARGGSTWKALYFCTMGAALVHLKRSFYAFCFKAHPLTSIKEEQKPSIQECNRQAKNLRKFYSIHLGAKTITHDGNPTFYMRAEVPIGLLNAWDKS